MPANLPYEEDFFQRIVNVNWSGGVVFVFGFLDGSGVQYVKVGGGKGGGKPMAQAISLSGLGSTLSVTGSSYALINGKSVFLIAGTRAASRGGEDGAGNPITFLDYYMMIYISNDGLKWSVAREEAAPGASDTSASTVGNACNLVWDPGESQFYYNQVKDIDGEPHDQIFNSKNGTGWGGAGGAATGGDPAYRSAFESHCKGNDCVDDRGQHVPDGVMTYDPVRQLTVKPVVPPITFYESGTHSFDFASGDPSETWGSANINVKVGSLLIAGSSIAVPGVKKVFCVAGANGIFMAGGSADLAGNSGAVALSTDSGVTWTPYGTYGSPVTTMVAASGARSGS